MRDGLVKIGSSHLTGGAVKFLNYDKYMDIIHINTVSPLYMEAVALRDAVLRRPLGLTLTSEELVLDHEREHVVAVLDGSVVGTVSLYMEAPTVLRIKQMAVDPAQQGWGIGGKLMQAAEARGRVMGAQSILLHARCTAQDFYDRQGYAVHGEAFAEQGIPHVVMVKRMVKSLA